jgi:hypothetical protein
MGPVRPYSGNNLVFFPLTLRRCEGSPFPVCFFASLDCLYLQTIEYYLALFNTMSRFLSSPGLEVVPAHDPEAVSRAAVYPDQGLEYIDSGPHIEQKNIQCKRPRICGLKKPTF